MRLPVDWINQYVPNELPLKQLAETLTNVGLEVEAVEEAGGTAVFDIKVTPNRGDCLSVVGVARELAMALGKQIRVSSPPVVESGPPVSELARVVLEDPGLCPRYSARVVRGIRIAPSPAWAQRRLELCGMRPINNLVDATNLVMLELGQPLHAFDYDLLCAHDGAAPPTIIVRPARSGERLVTIDGEARALSPEVLVIADTAGPVALAGIMGGSETEIHQGTSAVLLESAHFDPRTVRRGARALQMSSEACYRFERTVDPGGTVLALDRVCELIGDFAQAPVEVARGVVDAYPRPTAEVEITLRPERVNALLGVDLSAAEAAGCLRRLRLEVREGGGNEGAGLLVRVPSFRQDLKTEIDLVEEVARAYGYHNIPESLPTAAGVGRLPDELAFEREVRSLMRGLGLGEAVTSSLESPEALTRLGLAAGHVLARPVIVNNPKTVDRSQLRTTLITSLLEVLAHNRRHGVSDVGIFDLGRVYWSRGESVLPEQPQHLGIAGTGMLWRGRWALPRGAENWDFHALKGMVEALIEQVTGQKAEYRPHRDVYWQPGRAAAVRLEDEVIGYLGEVATRVREAYDLPDPVFAAELDLERLRAHTALPRFQPFSRFPAVTRDVAFLVPREIAAGDTEALIREAAGDNLESLSLFDAYEGKPLPKGQRNLAFSLSFRHPDRTLTDVEVEQSMERIRAALRERLEATIRE